MSMKGAVLLVAIGLILIVSCSRTATPAAIPTATMLPLATAAPIIATPPPGPTLALHNYMRQIYQGVLLDYARRVALNRDLLSAASSRSFDADMLCPGPEGASWQRFDDLALEASVIVPPPGAEGFHAVLVEALNAADQAAASYEWFCETYATFGQPAEGMWGRLSLQVRACEARIADLRSLWRDMGGEAMGLAW
jgi:hypothetical protein